MKKYGRKWRQNNPEEAKRKRDDPNYFKKKRELAKKRKQMVQKTPIVPFDNTKLVIEPQKGKGLKDFSTGPIVPPSHTSEYLDAIEKIDL